MKCSRCKNEFEETIKQKSLTKKNQKTISLLGYEILCQECLETLEDMR